MVSDEQPKPDRSGGLQRTVPPSVENEALHAERRQLTVVFVDIVGWTPLSERIDPEEFFAVIKTYRDICDGEIRRYGGHIARLIGVRGVMAPPVRYDVRESSLSSDV